MSPRQFTALVGTLLGVVGFFALLWPVNVTSDGLLGLDIECGSGFAMLDEKPIGGGSDWRSTCEDAVDSRRMWAWPLLVGGLVVCAGAGFVQTGRRDEAMQQS